MNLAVRSRTLRIGALVGGSTLVLTAAFVGVLALASGAPGLTDRLPLYVLVMAAAFVATVLHVERSYTADGRSSLATTSGVALATFLVVSLAGEGVAYAVRAPGRLLGSDLLVYFLAAGMIGTGLGYWGLRHWREFAATTGPGVSH